MRLTLQLDNGERAVIGADNFAIFGEIFRHLLRSDQRLQIGRRAFHFQHAAARRHLQSLRWLVIVSQRLQLLARK